ncbi:hypothetical protein LZ32DRAFT_399229 [Colletotrichum eremochloae]|nr:hypothetical protein LZ32DRAFT_399229 [Colletotrichum eremochloae]
MIKERREHYAQKKDRMFGGLEGKREPLVTIDFGTASDSGSDSGETCHQLPDRRLTWGLTDRDCRTRTGFKLDAEGQAVPFPQRGGSSSKAILAEGGRIHDRGCQSYGGPVVARHPVGTSLAGFDDPQRQRRRAARHTHLSSSPGPLSELPHEQRRGMEFRQ